MEMSDDDIHTILNSLGIIKNHTELLLLNNGKPEIEKERAEALNVILKRADKLITLVKSLN
ncbi:hypothetical protein HY626_04190 [Candidatus Uhrbacteria bacterium]|nr:hypothetical protein [Candidatus Uhrbacteria bacterium]